MPPPVTGVLAQEEVDDVTSLLGELTERSALTELQGS